MSFLQEIFEALHDHFLWADWTWALSAIVEVDRMGVRAVVFWKARARDL